MEAVIRGYRTKTYELQYNTNGGSNIKEIEKKSETTHLV